MQDIRLEYSSITKAGKKRKSNHDGIYAQVIDSRVALTTPTIGLFIISDGIGLQGDDVSNKVLRTISIDLNHFIYRRLLNEENTVSDKEIEDVIVASIQHADSQIIGVETDNSGASVTVALVIDTDIYIGHVGVTTFVLLNGMNAHRVNTIHLFTEKLIELGQITREEIINFPDKQYRVLGTESVVEVDIYHLSLNNQEAFALCTSGFCDSFNPDGYLPEIHQIALNSQDCHDACRRFLEFIQDKHSSAYADQSMILVSNGFPFRN